MEELVRGDVNHDVEWSCMTEDVMLNERAICWFIVHLGIVDFES
jgi:hypothetical protein